MCAIVALSAEWEALLGGREVAYFRIMIPPVVGLSGRLNLHSIAILFVDFGNLTIDAPLESGLEMPHPRVDRPTYRHDTLHPLTETEMGEFQNANRLGGHFQPSGL